MYIYTQSTIDILDYLYLRNFNILSFVLYISTF